MFSTSSTGYGAQHNARTLAAVAGDSARHRFLVGTCSLRQDNAIEVLEFDEETNTIACLGKLEHPAEMWCVAPSPYDARRLAVSASKAGGGCATSIYRTDFETWGRAAADEYDDDDDDGGPQLRPSDHANTWLPNEAPKEGKLNCEATLESDGYARSVLWCPKEHGGPDMLATLDATTLQRWDATSPSKASSTVALEGACAAAAWSPHSSDEVAVAGRFGVTTFDSRSCTAAQRLPWQMASTLSVDYNPNKPFTLAAAHDDGGITFWDARTPLRPLKVLRGHGHDCTQVLFNRFHDQLVISAGTDQIANLWRVSSISSTPVMEAPLVSEEDEEDVVDAADVLVRSFSQHDESINAVSWSACDAWVFASLSYDGRVLVHHVPGPEKYKILL
ncbi:WD40-repeat-containing domain protein [Pelagophyceae sp. CCMP2097]|nr:WD40-repeat-containing domain protein [Pelagophyceae sp. CCMP2097]